MPDINFLAEDEEEDLVFFAGDPENMLIAAEVKGSGLGWGASSTTRCSFH